jgi:hypothetical protein
MKGCCRNCSGFLGKPAWKLFEVSDEDVVQVYEELIKGSSKNFEY